ncbi:FAD-linked oxidoreductase aurO [Cladobotryum mycophilum]|uniref:FAD-linked oxidoreductase aurO n=1 Tax=Cladobotryum mycophilum TaxID=491253 RepID=A0ABR0SBB6_9HYPO
MTTPSGTLRSSVERHIPQLLQALDRYPSLPIFTPADAGFEERRPIQNIAIEEKPWAIVCPESEEEVVAVVRACSQSKPPVSLSIRVGGHDGGGRALISNGVVIDLRQLNSIALADDRASARVSGGILLGTLAKFLDDHDLMTPTGWSTTVGYVGWATGGGYGTMQGTHGFGVDQILGARLVKAGGEVVDTDQDPELLWALRGAGTGVLGVVVEVRIKTYPIPNMLGGTLMFPLNDAENVLTQIGKMHQPDEFSGEFTSVRVPDLGPALICLFNWTPRPGQEAEDLQEGKEFLEQICGMGNVLLNTVTEKRPYEFMKEISHDVPQTKYTVRSKLMKGLTPEFAKIISRNPVINENSAIIIHNAHGPSTKPDSDAVFPNRRPHLAIGLCGSALSNTDSSFETASNWVDEYVQRFENSGEVLGGGYMNFMHPIESNTLEVFGEDGTERLRKLKKKYDGENIFSRGYPSLT